MTSRLHPLFESDVMEAEGWLIERSARWATDFDEAVKAGLHAIVLDPRFFPRTEDGPARIETRECYIKRFEYRLIYALQMDELIVLALIHARRRPGSWTIRLKELR